MPSGTPKRYSCRDSVAMNLLPSSIEGKVETLDYIAEFEDKDNVILLVSSVISTISYNSAVNPPGGVWQNDTPLHSAGHVVIGYTHPSAYIFLMFSNTLALSLALLTIFLVTAQWTSKKLLLSRAVWYSMWVSLIAVPANFAASTLAIAPSGKSKAFNDAVLCCTFLPIGLAFLLVIMIQIFYYEENIRQLGVKLRVLWQNVKRTVGVGEGIGTEADNGTGTEAEGVGTEAADGLIGLSASIVTPIILYS
ncbi:uncharacterized protein LOC125189130 [Salvia hispanica]|uniref:uncharacterized protein LOC125189130 n=1 Tax=Salvia hispanica TaxID=49212 RepID=UPI002009AA66|nr:uncharacterized protein LOC125189130 [Salvia hispanica]XP_047942315.1 uncharacterized protein LOC125189130 [Salvia hispanica]XP_047942316.1 uncharacterized protein LOC125189130 [Salvia hispanica]XP_047942318.1 uncharacterized protein LOC125189130 [Salvia hispanica]